MDECMAFDEGYITWGVFSRNMAGDVSDRFVMFFFQSRIPPSRSTGSKRMVTFFPYRYLVFKALRVRPGCTHG